MNPRGFSFPPPPPPTQQQQQQPQQHHQPSYSSASYYTNYSHGQRGGMQRGRGRGFGGRGGRGVRAGRGGRGGNHYGIGYPGTATPPSMYAPMNYTGFASQALPATAPTIQASPFPPSRSPEFRQPQNTTPTYASPKPFSQHAAAPLQPYPHQSSAYNNDDHNNNNNNNNAQAASAYSAVVPPTLQLQALPQAPVMVPPMRWGSEGSPTSTQFPSAHTGHGRGGHWSFNPHGNYGSKGDKPMRHGNNKRDFVSAFGKPQSASPRTQAPPSVPSFGNPLPSKPPPPVETLRKPKKKKRNYNQLGLTPKTEEHESSEEEDDVDEESRLGPGVVPASTPLQFTYKGRTSTLRTPSDIAAWIEERRKRYPTQARIDEKKKDMEEAKRAREDAAKQKGLRKQEAKRQKGTQVHKEREKQKHEDKEQQAGQADPMDAAAKAKKKADKLRRKLMKEEKRVAKAEVDAEQARLKSQGLLQKGSSEDHAAQTTQKEKGDERTLLRSPAGAASSDRIGTTSNNHDPQFSDGAPDSRLAEPGLIGSSESHQKTTTSDVGHADGSMMLSPSDASDSSDWTSSSGSDDSSSVSEENDFDSAPEEVTTRREGPERVPPPPREGKKTTLCRHFAKRGHCLRGDKCKFLHEMPERKGKPKQQQPEKKGQGGLLQMLLARQKEGEDERVMQAISWLGENGLLNEPTAVSQGEQHQEQERSKTENIVGVSNGTREDNIAVHQEQPASTTTADAGGIVGDGDVS